MLHEVFTGLSSMDGADSTMCTFATYHLPPGQLAQGDVR